MSKYNNNTNSGTAEFNVISTGALFVGGKRFKDLISELITEDQFEQSEITELKLLVQYLNTSGLSSEWIVDNNNKNQDLKSLITELQTKLANIDTTTLTESSVLNNDNRNSVLKGRLDTAETDIDNLETRETNVENKTKYITTSTTATIPGLSGVTPAYIKIRPFETDEPIRAIDLFVNPDETTDRGYLVAPVGRQTYMRMIGTANLTSLTQPQYNKIEMQTNKFSLEANDIKITCNPLDLNLTLGEISVPGTITIGAKSDTVNIGTEPPNPLFENKINIGVVGFPTKSTTSIKGFLGVDSCEWLLPKSDKFGLDTLIAFIPTAGLPAWVLAFALGSSIPSFEYSDIFVMKDGPTGVNKTGQVTTSNEPKVKSFVLFNRDLNVARLTPIEGTFVASGTISKTTLNGSIRNSCFLDGGGDNKICLKHHNISASDITEWATTEGNDKVNVLEIGGNSGILLHQGAANAGTDIKIINSKAGNIVLKVGTGGGIKADTKESFTVLHDANYPGAAIGRLSPQAFDTNVTNRTNNPIARLEIECVANRKGIRLFGYDPASPFILGPDETNLTNQLINTPAITATTATAGSLVINANYTGNTDARLYKNADNKLMWNGAEVGAGGVSSGGITYMINVASNITNPSSTPTQTIITAAYTSNPQRTITQAITANTAFYIAKYTTEVFDEVTNPILTGLQQLNQYIIWNSQNQVGQIYGQLWFQATAIGFGVLYQRTYASPVTTTAATFINGTPIPTPKGLYNIKFQRVLFPNINLVVTSGPVALRYRVEGYDFLNGWVTLSSMGGTAPPTYSNSATNITITLDSSQIINQTSSVGGKTAVRLVLYIDSGTGTISQTSAGGVDLAAYSLIGLGENTPALFRTMLYDGTNAKVVTPYSTTPKLVEYDLPIDAPYNVSAFPLPTLSTDLYFIQPSGGTANHAITLYFNEGSISHYHSTISPTQTIPTLAQVLNSGATASQAINMNTNKISGITTLEGSSNGNWNVKEITAAQGSGISVTPTNGSYAIANSGVLSVAAAAGTPGITATTTNGAVILQNSGVLSVAAAAGTPGITATTTNGAVILQNSGIISITEGAGISVSTSTSGVATITNTGIGTAAVLQNIRDEHQSLYEVGALPRKPDYWATNWSVADSTARSHGDMYVSVDGKIIATASGAGFTIRYSTNYGTSWNDGNVSASGLTWSSICGTSTGSKLFAFGGFIAQNQAQSLLLYSSTNQGAIWTQITSSAFNGLSSVNRVRCSGDGKYILANITNVGTNGRTLFSSDGGATWVVKNISAGLPSGYTNGVAMSRSGAVQFITWISDTGTTNSGVFRSMDYGATFSQVFGHIIGANWTHIECDATGRFVWATRYVNINTQDSQAWRSDDYGIAWFQAGMNSIEDIWVSATGQFMAGVSVPNTAVIDSLQNRRFLVYSVDYGRTVQTLSLSNTTTFRTISGSADGSVLVLGSVNFSEGTPSYSGDGLIRIARQGQQNIQDLQVTGAGTLSKANGIYSLNITSAVAAEELWASGSLITTTDIANPFMDWSSFAGNIDLTLYNIRYEIDCYWNLSGSVYPAAFVHIAPNNVTASDYQSDPNTSNTFVGGVTHWTNMMAGGTWGGITGEFNQSYRNRFMGGFLNAINGELSEQRCRTLLNGELRLQTRPTGQASFVSDPCLTERNIFNRFTCNNYTTQSIGGTWLTYQSVGTDYQNSCMRVDGTATFAAQTYWSGSLASGINRIGLRLNDGFTPSDTRPRSAQYIYRIYRVRKGVANSV